MTRLLLVVLVAATITGCGKTNTSKKPGDTGDGRGGVGAPGGEPTAAQRAAGNDLKKLAIAYHDYIFQHNKPPANIADLAKFAPGDLIGKVQSGTYTLQMNVDVFKVPAGATNTLLGYERNVPTEGGVVVMGDGSTPYMTKEEFAAATKGGR